jgi:amino-acid N-acetyltransferase
MTSDIQLRDANADDLSAVCSLLTAAHLPLDGVEEQFGAAYVIAETDGEIVGVEGVERYGDAGLLRSAAVAQAWRGRGIGEQLTRERLAYARRQGMREVWLLTTTASDFFPRFGFERVTRDEAPAPLQASREFRDACPASAIAMRIQLLENQQ